MENWVGITVLFVASMLCLIDLIFSSCSLKVKFLTFILLLVPLLGPIFYLILRPEIKGIKHDAWLNHTSYRGDYRQHDLMKMLLESKEKELKDKQKNYEKNNNGKKEIEK